MKRPLSTLGLASLSLLGLAVAPSVASATQCDLDNSPDLVLNETDYQAYQIDAVSGPGPAGSPLPKPAQGTSSPSAGDVTLISGTIRSADGSLTGSIHSVCTHINDAAPSPFGIPQPAGVPTDMQQCEQGIVFNVPGAVPGRHQIRLEGTFSARRFEDGVEEIYLAVVGGTGRFRGVSGEARVKAAAPGDFLHKTIKICWDKKPKF